MLKYLYVAEVFQEIPNEFSLAIAISGCTIRCTGCHSRELWEDKGNILDAETLCGLLNQHQGVTCLLLMGGERDIDSLTELLMYAHKRVKTAWYCGLDMLPREHQGITNYLDWIKLGHYDMELGGLNSPTTNQRLYQLEYRGNDYKQWKDITYLLRKNEELCGK